MTNKGMARYGNQRTVYEKNKKKILKEQKVCGICGKPVNKKLKFPHPLSACIDHIIPLAKGGHPSDINNLQLAHWCCNREKSDKLPTLNNDFKKEEDIGNRVLPHLVDWIHYKSKESNRGGYPP